MSFWDNVKKLAKPYDDDYDYDDDTEDDYDEQEETPRSRRSAPASSAEPSTGDFDIGASPFASGSTPTGFSGQVVNSGSSNKQEVVLFRPGSVNDASSAADDLRAKKAVIVNMENVDKAMARRIVDFLSGCIYAIDGKVKKVAQCTYLFCPHNMDVVGDLENLQSEVESYV